VVIGENQTFLGAEAHLRAHGVELTVLNDPSCVRMMEVFIRENPNLWNEDIGEA
jgi:cytosine deaminase